MIKQPINRKKDKVFSFLLGLVYGYRSADMELKVLSLSEFDPYNHKDEQVFYLDRKRGMVKKNSPLENPTHIVTLREDLKEKKVKIFIYKG
jgi:hypothetical protein